MTVGIDGYPGSNSDVNVGGGTGGVTSERFRGEWDMSVMTTTPGGPAVPAELTSSSQIDVIKNSDDSYTLQIANGAVGTEIIPGYQAGMLKATTTLGGNAHKNSGIKTLRIKNPAIAEPTIQNYLIFVHDTTLDPINIYANFLLSTPIPDNILYVFSIGPSFDGTTQLYNTITAAALSTYGSGQQASTGNSIHMDNYTDDIYMSVDFSSGDFTITSANMPTLNANVDLSLLSVDTHFTVSFVMFYSGALSAAPEFTAELDVSAIDSTIGDSAPFSMGGISTSILLPPTGTQDGDIFLISNPNVYLNNPAPLDADYLKITNNLQTLIPWTIPQTDAQISDIADAKITEQLTGQGTIKTGIIDTINGQLLSGGSILNAISTAITEAGNGGNVSTMLPTANRYYFNKPEPVLIEGDPLYDNSVTVPTLYTEITVEYNDATSPCYIIFNNFTLANYPPQTIFKINILASYDITVIFQTNSNTIINEIVPTIDGMTTYLFSVLHDQNIVDDYISYLGKYLNITPAIRPTIYEVTSANVPVKCDFSGVPTQNSYGFVLQQNYHLDLLHDGFSNCIFQIDPTIDISYFSQDGYLALADLNNFSVKGKGSFSVERPEFASKGSLEKISVLMYNPTNVQAFSTVIKIGTLGESPFTTSLLSGLCIRITLGDTLDTFTVYQVDNNSVITSIINETTIPSPELVSGSDLYNIEFDFDNNQINIYSKYHSDVNENVPVGVLHFDATPIINSGAYYKLGVLLNFSSGTTGIATLRIANGGIDTTVGNVRPFFYNDFNNNNTFDVEDGDELVINTEQYTFDNKTYRLGDVIKLYANKTKAVLSGSFVNKINARTHIFRSEGYYIPNNAKTLKITGVSGTDAGSNVPVLFFHSNPIEDSITITSDVTVTLVCTSITGAQFLNNLKSVDFVAGIPQTFTFYRHPLGNENEYPATWY